MGRMSILAKRLAEARKRAGISSQRELGVMAGLHISGADVRMFYYEAGQNQPKLSLMKRIAAELHTPLPYFYCEDDVLANLILKFGTLDEAQKKKLLDFVDTL